MNVSNRGCIRRLSLRALFANRTRNIVAVLAIALTAVLFTSLFTIALSINEGYQQANFRQAGGWAHGTFKRLSWEQVEQLGDDPAIRQWGARLFVGMPQEIPFNKDHVEVSYCDETSAHWSFCDPEEGRLPQEGTDEAATDTRVLELLGIEPELGQTFTMTFDVDGHETTQTFTLCGWWEHDEAMTASQVLLPQSRAEAVLKEAGVQDVGVDGLTGTWSMDIMLGSSLHIDEEMHEILARQGYQGETAGEDNYISMGVNWGYTGTQMTRSMDPLTVLAMSCALLLILFTGYLIIYNVFQISVAGDIRFYGLLKTIGTTPRQLRRIIRTQALLLSLVGIPAGLLLGWLVGGTLVPVIIGQLNQVTSVVSADPLLFLFSALFALVTVLLSTYRPGRMAGKVSPIEALRYTEGAAGKKALSRGKKGVSLLSMARANLGRSRSKTGITILSLSLAVVLLTLTVTFTNGFDMNKYLRTMPCDYQIADAGYFQTGNAGFVGDMAVPEELIQTVCQQGGVSQGGRVYGKTSAVEEFVTEEYYRSMRDKWYSKEALDSQVAYAQRSPEGLLVDSAQLYGMERYVLDQLTVLDGDLSKLYEPGSRFIAAVCFEDDYGLPQTDSYWANVGDTVTLRYVDEYEYYYMDTGEIIPELNEAVTDSGRPWNGRAKTYHDVEYTVAALVSVPSTLSYRYYGADEFILNDQTFIQDTGTSSIMYYAFDATDDSNAAMESFLQNYTENVDPQFDYESKATYAAEFENFRTMFLLLGGALSFIVGLVGMLNFFNAILTGITARRRELAVLQSIGMTARQLRTMLALEGLLYTLGAALLALALIVVTAPFIGPALSGLFWFFTYRLTLWPIAVVLPLFGALGVLIPVLSCRSAQRYSVVERLRQE